MATLNGMTVLIQGIIKPLYSVMVPVWTSLRTVWTRLWYIIYESYMEMVEIALAVLEHGS